MTPETAILQCSVLLWFVVLFSPRSSGALRENMCEPNVPPVNEEQDAEAARDCRHTASQRRLVKET